MTARRLVITGASGFIGRQLVTLASSEGRQVSGVVRTDEGVAGVRRAGGLPLKGALDGTELRRACEGADAVIHLAMIGSERHGQTFEDVNVRGTQQVIDAAEAGGVGTLVLFSGLGVAHYGLRPRCTNRYFLSKLRAEAAAFAGSVPVTVLRPSYVIGPRDGLVKSLLAELAAGEVVWPGDGLYRLQPVAVRDAAAAALAAADAPSWGAARPPQRVVDLVGPEKVSYADFVARLAETARGQGRPADHRVRTVTVEAADTTARAAGEWRGLPPEDVDVLLCDEVSEPGPLVGLLGRSLTPLAEAMDTAVRGTR